ncbi:hypothetical protein DAPPUDRAFT_221836 [Daphnia pulex]|uniref:Uncharacterized protein n=1 Tax=Daphnia pulex TaxID=6669 RepID=E9FZT2_DAPPU|nr:hypothetical protein DAPPUDRAFT_221836 [Daphnia pulex]|eukprot:EFX87208.1 hypothetical protein DAPPUDRAFT_221836 [Daphnia pulex]
MASRLIFAIAAVVAVLSLCCEASPSHKLEDMKEAEQLHWNKTITKMVNSTSRLADKVESVLNRTADTVFTAANMVGGVAGGLTAIVGEKLIEGSNKWTELKNKTAQRMANTRAKMDAAKQKIHDKLSAGVEKLVEKGNQLVNFAVGIVGQVVGKVTDTVQGAKSKVQEHKLEKNARISFVPLSTKLSTLSARIVHPARPTPVAQVVVREENATTTQSSVSQSTYSY